MGAYSPPEFWTPDLAARVRREILIPAAAAMVKEGCPFKGVLFAGLMLTADGPKVVEFNARLGDPEAQVILPRLETDLVDICEAVIDGTLSRVPVRWGGSPHVGVVIASGGYPGKYQTGYPITGLSEAAKEALIFHAGTSTGAGGQVTTNGGRVLTAVASADTIGAARHRAYDAVAGISFTDCYHRRDIAARASEAEGPPPHRQTAGTKGGPRQ
jgi:phosphoribosylamine--glycine ligase